MAGPSWVQRASYRVARAATLTPCKVAFRPRVSGRGRVPRTGAYIVAPSHRSLMDIFFAAFVTRRRVRFMAKEELFEKPFLAWLFDALGGFPVARGTADRTALRAAQAALAGGEPVVVFPEGTRHEGPEIAPLFGGAAYLATKLGVPLVPVGIGGSEQILASGRVVPRLRRVAIVVGEPIHPVGTARATRRERDELTDRLHTELQARFDEACEHAGVEPRAPRPASAAASGGAAQ